MVIVWPFCLLLLVGKMVITTSPICLETFLLQSPNPHCGAVATFVGIVRDHHAGKAVKRLFYDCYEPLAEKEMYFILNEMRRQFPIDDIQAIHRTGWLEIGEAAVAIWVSAPHRKEAFRACEETIFQIKKRLPIWKKEVYVDESSEWVRCDHSYFTEQP